MNGNRISFSWLKEEWFREMSMINPEAMHPTIVMTISSPMKTLFANSFAIGAM